MSEEFNPQVIKELDEAKKEFTELTSKDTKTEVTASDVKTENSVTEKSDQRQFTEVELEQMEKGWDPHRTGADAVSAIEYKRVGEIIEAKRKASKEAQLKSREIEELNKTVQLLVDHQRKADQAIYEKALREIQVRKEKAKDEGDVLEYERAVKDQELEQAKPILATPAPVAPPLSEEVKAFQEENKTWLTGTSAADRSMQAYVKARVDEYMQTNPNIDERVAIASIKEGLQTQFPSKFKNPNQEKTSMTMPSTVGSSKQTGNYSLSRLDLQQRMEFEMIKKADSTYTAEEYIKQLELVGRLAK